LTSCTVQESMSGLTVGATVRSFRRKKQAGIGGDRERLYEILEEKGGGSILRGWRAVLDQDGVLKVGFKEFCKAMTTVGAMEVDAAGLFEQSDDQKFLHMELVAPVQASLLNRFREWVKKLFGGPAGMFTAFDIDGLEYIDRQGFVNGCKEGQFKGTVDDYQELFNCLDFDSGGSVTTDEVMFLELDPLIRDQEMLKLKMRSKFERQRLHAFLYGEDNQMYPPKHRRAQRPWLAGEFENLPVLVCQRRLEHYQDTYRKSVQARVAFLKELREIYTNEVRAWRRGLDTDCKFIVNKVDLRQFLRQRDLSVDFNALWRGMDNDGDEHISLEEITPGGALQLALFRSWAHEKFGSCAAVWDLPKVWEARELEADSGRWASDKKMKVGLLAAVLKKLGWDSDANSVLYQSLDLYGCGFISLPDLWWLDLWIPPEWLVSRPDPQALIELQTCVHMMFPHPLVAWRSLLDSDSDNMVSWSEFQNACRKLRFTGNVGSAWRMLDRDVSGTISLSEWDPKGSELLLSFKSWAEHHFGSVELAFKAFDKEGSGSITLNDLKQACKRLQWEGDVKALFLCLNAKCSSEAADSHGAASHGGVRASNTGGRTAQAKCIVLKDIVFLDHWIDHQELKWALHQMEGGAPGSDRKQLRRSRSSGALSSSDGLPKTPKSPKAKSPKATSPKSTSRDLWLVQEAVDSPKSRHSAVLGQSTPSEHQNLHRSYHVLAYSKIKRPWDAKIERLRAKSTSALPWLDKINRIDDLYAGGAGAGP